MSIFVFEIGGRARSLPSAFFKGWPATLRFFGSTNIPCDFITNVQVSIIHQCFFAITSFSSSRSQSEIERRKGSSTSAEVEKSFSCFSSYRVYATSSWSGRRKINLSFLHGRQISRPFQFRGSIGKRRLPLYSPLQALLTRTNCRHESLQVGIEIHCHRFDMYSLGCPGKSIQGYGGEQNLPLHG